MSISPAPNSNDIRKFLAVSFLLVLAVASVPLLAGETFLSKPASAWTQQQALQILADSPWARTVTPTFQDVPCGYQHPAFDGPLFPFGTEVGGALSPLPEPINAKPDTTTYIVRLASAKPVQAAAQRLLELDGKWAPYLGTPEALYHDRPTDIPGRFYNIADEITVAVVLKQPASDGSSFFDYVFEERNGNGFPAHGIFITPCAVLRTSNGQVTPLLLGYVFAGDKVTGLRLSFPSKIDGQPLLSHPNEQLEFRFIAKQRVFDATFTMSPADLLDGSERVLRIPSSLPDSPPATP